MKTMARAAAGAFQSIEPSWRRNLIWITIVILNDDDHHPDRQGQ
jgi:hypothetical protein